VVPQELTITRVAITTEADAEKKGTEMGRKYIVPYGLYRCEGYISANLARKTTGFSEDDLQLLWMPSSICSSAITPPREGRCPFVS
jgi:CRISPR-associated protein Csd2